MYPCMPYAIRQYKIYFRLGGSISGRTLANGLLKQSQIKWDLFESKESLPERGAAIAMHTNALAALKCMGNEADRILRDGKESKRGMAQYGCCMALTMGGIDIWCTDLSMLYAEGEHPREK
ncbi:hypothetical protein AC579_10389 [Pseudocercospora musae]|uniref:Uncharacterized protein n=1 Tax=Pseudocercospora musae TaxID=113226 RepID=A0A139IBY3_9PEZI|nr:hypothetical protein AC579_10389 [Pseudocercospora musae]